MRSINANNTYYQVYSDRNYHKKIFGKNYRKSKLCKHYKPKVGRIMTEMLDYYTNAYLHKISDNWIKRIYNGMKYYLLLCLGWPDAGRITKYRSQNHMEIVMEV